MTSDDRLERIDGVWGKPQAQITAGRQWFSHPLVTARINERCSGDPARDAYGALRLLLDARGVAVPVPVAASLGCGMGELERGLVQYGMAELYEGYDIAPSAIATAQSLAAEAGLASQVRYICADLDHHELPTGRYGIVFGHQAVHHVTELERLFANVWNAMSPGGILHLHEFVGPRRFQWTEAQLEGARSWLDQVPEHYRTRHDGVVRTGVGRPSIEEVIQHDPSESVRSDEIIPVMSRWFDTIDHRPIGGALCHLALQDIPQNFPVDDPVANDLIADLFAREDRMMREGVVLSDFAIITAVRRDTPKPPRVG